MCVWFHVFVFDHRWREKQVVAVVVVEVMLISPAAPAVKHVKHQTDVVVICGTFAQRAAVQYKYCQIHHAPESM